MVPLDVDYRCIGCWCTRIDVCVRACVCHVCMYTLCFGARFVAISRFAQCVGFDSSYLFVIISLLFHMYSDASEFDGEDEDVASWSSKRTNDENHDDSSTSRTVHEFGEFVDNYGWIQCRSKSYPGRVYFHNTHSNCNTWYRPISRYIDVPFISVNKVSSN